MRKLIFCLVVADLLAGQTLALDLWLEPKGTYATGIFDDRGAQIVDYHMASKRLFVTNHADKTIDVVSIEQVDNLQLLFQIPLSGEPTSVAVNPDLALVAVAIEGVEVTDRGMVEFYTLDGELLGSVVVGSLPNMLIWTLLGQKVLVANAGVPTNTEYLPEDGKFVDPNGSVSIITLDPGISLQQKVQNATVVEVGFEGFNDKKQELLDKGVRIIGPGATVAQDLEPEHITVDKDNRYAWVTLQENNALAKIDIVKAEVVDIVGLGYKDHSVEGNGLDASNKNYAINIQTWPVSGMYQPDAIDSFTIDDEMYFIIANEGNARDFEEARVGKLDLSEVFGTPEEIEELQEYENLGRLKVTKVFPATKDDEGNYTSLYSYGGRSFSILDADGNFVFDSGDQLEQITAEQLPEYFNSTDDKTDFDDRSDDKGPEPEHVVVGKIYGHMIAFVGLERISGIMTFDVSDPANPVFLDYVNNRNFEADPESPEAGDLGTEGLVFIPASQSPNGYPLVVAAHDISGTTTVFQVQVNVQPSPNDLPDLAITSEDINFVPIGAEPCEPVTISATVWNKGVAHAENVEVIFKDRDTIIGSQSIASILPGDSDTVSIEYTWLKAGFKLVTVTADPYDDINEIDESNNSGGKLYQVGDVSDMNAVIEVSCSVPALFPGGGTGSISGEAFYRIEVPGEPDFVYPVKGASVSVQIFDSNGVQKSLLGSFTDIQGRFSKSFTVPGNSGDCFDVETTVTDVTLTGECQGSFCVGERKDLWIEDVNFVPDANPDVNETITIEAIVHSESTITVSNVPVTIRDYDPTGGIEETTSQSIPEIKPGESNSISTEWSSTIEGVHCIEATLGPGYSDDKNWNNQARRALVVGPMPNRIDVVIEDPLWGCRRQFERWGFTGCACNR